MPIAPSSPAAMPTRVRPPSPPWPPRVLVALAVTMLAAAVMPVLVHVPLPFVDLELARDPLGRPIDAAALTIGALGVEPWLAAMFFVELVALAVPRWRSLRHTSEGRARLVKAATILGALLVLRQAKAAQGYVVVSQIEALRAASGADSDLGMSERLVIIAALVAGACVVRFAAWAVDRYGVGNGIVVVLAGEMTLGLGAQASRIVDGLAAETVMPLQVLMAVVCVVAVIAGTGRGVRLPSATRVVSPSIGMLPASFGVVAGSVGPIVAVPLLDVGFPSFFTSASFWALTFALASFPVLHAMWASPQRLAVAWARADGRAMATEADQTRARAAVRSALLPTVFFNSLVLFAGLSVGLSADGEAPFVGVMAIALLTAGLLDARRDVHAHRRADLVAVGSLASLVDVGLVRDALAAEGIDAHLRNLRVRVLQRFFAPWAPAEVLVPREHARRATDVVRTLVDRVHRA